MLNSVKHLSGMTNKKQRRGAHRRGNSVFIGAWIPAKWIPAIDQIVAREDSDRSKIIRRVIERKIQEGGNVTLHPHYKK